MDRTYYVIIMTDAAPISIDARSLVERISVAEVRRSVSSTTLDLRLEKLSDAEEEALGS